MKPYTRAEAEADMADAIGRNDMNGALRAAADLDRMGPAAVVGLGAAALWYAEHGLPVFPLQSGGKVPLPRTHGVNDATTDTDVIDRWWQLHPDSNIGLATGHRVDVIDFAGPQAHAAWGQRYGEDWTDAEVDVLGTVSTPRAGGLHIYIPVTGDPNAANIGGLIGVDFRGIGGYVVAPPSVTLVGRYRWLRSLNLERADG